MSYCRVHDGLHYEHEDGCPKCRDDAEQAASDRSEIINGLARSREDLAAAAVYIADSKNNPGDYDCPYCKFRTLKMGASRCPSCHGEPGLLYWAGIEAKERDARLRVLAAEKAAKEEWERAAPARAAAAAREKRAQTFRLFRKIYFVCAVPFLSVVSVVVAYTGKLPEVNSGFGWLLFPVINWLIFLVGFLEGNIDRISLLISLIFWSVVLHAGLSAISRFSKKA